MKPVTDLAIDALATSRLSRLITDDYVGKPIRKFLRSKGDAGEYVSTCPACTSMYTAVVVQVLPKKLRVVLALSEITVLFRAAESLPEAISGETSGWGLKD